MKDRYAGEWPAEREMASERTQIREKVPQTRIEF
jgi:hypothetical protein